MENERHFSSCDQFATVQSLNSRGRVSLEERVSKVDNLWRNELYESQSLFTHSCFDFDLYALTNMPIRASIVREEMSFGFLSLT
jgi:hypothetical protein